MSVGAKICGLKTREAVEAAVEGGAAYVGFVFYRQSPRHLEIEAANALRNGVPAMVKAVAVLVEPEEPFLEQLVERVRPDMIQLHGRETPETVAGLHKRYDIPVMKALSVACAADLAPVAEYAAVADMLLFDAKPQAHGTRPGGNALSFDWSLLRGQTIQRPWMLSGGLSARNVREAVHRSGAHIVDVSSGVERAPGEKDPRLIREFLDVVKRL